MGDKTNISWADHTFNVWWGCNDAPSSPHSDDPSPECANCYARTFDRRLGGSHWGHSAPRKFFGDAYWNKPLRWNEAAGKAGVRASVFCSSMADWAEVHPDPDIRARQFHARERLWWLIQFTPWLDWLLLSKLPQNWQGMLPWTRHQFGPGRWIMVPNNVILGVTAGVAGSMWRVAYLRATPAFRRFVSAEPLLEHIQPEDWDSVLGKRCECSQQDMVNGNHKVYCSSIQPGIDWLIVGDESGTGRRPAQLDWVRTAREAALRHGVKFHFKQWNASGKTVHLPVLDGRTWSQRPE